MFRGYDISDEFSEYCNEEACDMNSEFMLNMIRESQAMWDNLESDNEIKITKVTIKGKDNIELTAKIFEPYNIKKKAPCLVYYHGGGFLVGPSIYQMRNVREYALRARCKVVFVDYRLAPQNPYPAAVEDCYSTLLWVAKNAKNIGINKSKIAVGGDSAGGNLAAAICQVARDRKGPHICFQMLIYPLTDYGVNDESMRTFVDTPIWNSELNKVMWQAYLKDGYDEKKTRYAAPLLAKSLKRLPNAYIETAEFDCLRDQGKNYAEALKDAHVKVKYVATKGTIHAFDMEADSNIVRACLNMRVKALKKAFK